MKEKKNNTVVLVTDAHELSGLGAVRSLGRAGYRVIAGYPNDLEPPPAKFSRWCYDAIAYPNPWRNNLGFIKWMLSELSTSKYDVILPISEAVIYAIAINNIKRPHNRTKIIIPDKKALFYTLSKFHATQLALKVGINIPGTFFIDNSFTNDRLKRFIDKVGFPVVVRTDNFFDEDTGRYVKGTTNLFYDFQEIKTFLDEYSNIPTNILMQEKKDGDGTGVFQLHWNGHVLLDFAHKRLHSVPWTGGASSFRKSIVSPELSKLGHKFLSAINYKGVAMIECLESKGKHYFIEINGRLWGSIALALHAGVDFPRILLECYLNSDVKQIKKPTYREGVRCRNTIPGEIYYVVSVLKTPSKDNPPNKIKTILEFFGLSLDPRIKSDFFWLNDPKPWIVNNVQIFRELTKKVFKLIHNKKLEKKKSFYIKKLKRKKPIFLTWKGVKKILFVCYGNISRSPFAELYWNKKIKENGIQCPIATSAGFHPTIDRKVPIRFEKIYHSYGLDASLHRSKLLNQDLIDNADLIFLMDGYNLVLLDDNFPNALNKTFLLGHFSTPPVDEIDDPYCLPPKEAVEVFDVLSKSLDHLFIDYLSHYKKSNCLNRELK